jgi:hypothetical protein
MRALEQALHLDQRQSSLIGSFLGVVGPSEAGDRCSVRKALAVKSFAACYSPPWPIGD